MTLTTQMMTQKSSHFDSINQIVDICFMWFSSHSVLGNQMGSEFENNKNTIQRKSTVLLYPRILRLVSFCRKSERQQDLDYCLTSRIFARSRCVRHVTLPHQIFLGFLCWNYEAPFLFIMSKTKSPFYSTVCSTFTGLIIRPKQSLCTF